MSILKEFYDGEIAPVEKIIQPETKYRPLAKAIGDGRKYFENQLPEKDRVDFKEWNKQITEYEAMIKYTNFSCGFRLSAIFSFEIFTGKDSK